LIENSLFETDKRELGTEDHLDFEQLIDNCLFETDKGELGTEHLRSTY
jgi:hypothetical protein